MKDRAIFTALAEILDVPNDGPDSKVNPFLKVARFVFADDKGAPLSTATATGFQGIEVEDFDEIISTALDMPVKMNFTGKGVESHNGSYVIGHMRKMDKVLAENNNKLVAEAVLYAEEYPDEVKYLQEAFAMGKAPGISYEVAYGNSTIKDGVEWIKNLITCAATFVDSPAYGNRTALLALASAKDEDFVNTMKTLVAQAEGTNIDTPTPNKGGKNVDEKELEKVQAELATLKAEAATKTGEIAALNEQLSAKDAELNTANETIATLQREKVTESRVSKFTEAGFMLEADAEKAEKKKAFWLSLSDEAFDEYIADLMAAKAMAAKPEKKAEASLRTTPVPRLDTPSTDGIEVPSFKFRS